MEKSIRQFEARDQEAVYRLHVTAMKQAGTYVESTPSGEQWDQDFQNIEDIYINNNGEFYVVTMSSTIVGIGALRKIDVSTAEVKRMRVEPSFQGQGLGKLILDALITRAKELGYTKLILDVAEKQTTAQHLYETRGFIEYAKGELGGQETRFYELYL